MAKLIFKQWDDSIISLGLGALVVAVSGILVYNFFSTTSQELLSDLSANMRESARQEQSQDGSMLSNEQRTSDDDKTENSRETPTPTAELIALGTIAPTKEVTIEPTPATMVVSTPTVSENLVAQNNVADSENVAKVGDSTRERAEVARGENLNTISDSHTVGRGETLWGLAQEYYGSGFEWKRIAQANNISKASALKVGAQLVIPRQGMISATQTDTPSYRDGSVETADADNVKIGVSGGVGQALNSNQVITHTVTRGENLSTLTAQYCGSSVSWVTIAQDNSLANPSIIHAGNQIRFDCRR